jgi:hypothetical protein
MYMNGYHITRLDVMVYTQSTHCFSIFKQKNELL